MKKFFGEFKKFITRGNVVDMAVGVIVGSSFTAIVNGLSNFVLKPFINFLLFICFGDNSQNDIFTFLHKVTQTVESVDANGNPIFTEEVDLTQSIYIDWGSLISAIINFFLIAFVLFVIVKVINKARENNKNLLKELNEGQPSKEDRKEMKKRGIKFSNTEAVAAFYAEKAQKAAEAKAAAEEKARQDRLANPTTEDLLKQIIELIKKEQA